MPRPRKCRLVKSEPCVALFKPRGIPAKMLESVNLAFEELEAIRLKDLEGLEQTEAARQMNISRATFQRVLKSARTKLSDALINGKAIRIEGGNYAVSNRNHIRRSSMKIAVSTADGVSICGHLGRCSKFFVYEVDAGSIVSREIREVTPVHGPGEHGHHAGEHSHHGSGEHVHHHAGGHGHGGVIQALSDTSAIITNGMGGHFATALQAAGIDPVITSESNPDVAVKAYLDGTLGPTGGGCGCGCGH